MPDDLRTALDVRAALDVLLEARAKIVPLRNWWTPLRESLDLCSEDACCAMTAFPDFIDTPGAELALEVLADAMGCHVFDVPAWNDSHSHEDVVRAFGMAIAGLHRQILPQSYRNLTHA